jgi:hypothetical protein
MPFRIGKDNQKKQNCQTKGGKTFRIYEKVPVEYLKSAESTAGQPYSVALPGLGKYV